MRILLSNLIISAQHQHVPICQVKKLNIRCIIGKYNMTATYVAANNKLTRGTDGMEWSQLTTVSFCEKGKRSYGFFFLDGRYLTLIHQNPRHNNNSLAITLITKRGNDLLINPIGTFHHGAVNCE